MYLYPSGPMACRILLGYRPRVKGAHFAKTFDLLTCNRPFPRCCWAIYRLVSYGSEHGLLSSVTHVGLVVAYLLGMYVLTAVVPLGHTQVASRCTLQLRISFQGVVIVYTNLIW